MAHVCEDCFSVGSNTQAAADESGSDGQASLGLMLGKWQADDTGCGCDITLHSLWHFSAPQFPPPPYTLCTRHITALRLPSSRPSSHLLCHDLGGFPAPARLSFVHSQHSSNIFLWCFWPMVLPSWQNPTQHTSSSGNFHLQKGFGPLPLLSPG